MAAATKDRSCFCWTQHGNTGDRPRRKLFPQSDSPLRQHGAVGVQERQKGTAVRRRDAHIAIVVHAILKRAGCSWAKYTASAKAVYDMAYAAGWRPSATQSAGCLVAWNSRWKGKRPRIGRDQPRSAKVSSRHLGITTGSWMAVDNTSYLSRPSAYITLRPVRYEWPIFLCPPDKANRVDKTRRNAERK